MNPRYRVSRAAIELLKRFEGYRRHAAKLGDGRWTIGYGHTMTARAGAQVSEQDAEALLLYDLIGLAHAVNEAVYASLNQNQFDALCSFAFNLGLENFRASAVLKRLNEGAFLEAALGMELWRKAEVGGERIVIDALVRRRAVEKALFLTPPGEEWTPSPSPVLPPSLDDDAIGLVPTLRPALVTVSLNGETVLVSRDGHAAVRPAPPEPEPESEPEPPPPREIAPPQPAYLDVRSVEVPSPAPTPPELIEPPPPQPWPPEPLRSEPLRSEPPEVEAPVTIAAASVAQRLETIFQRAAQEEAEDAVASQPVRPVFVREAAPEPAFAPQPASRPAPVAPPKQLDDLPAFLIQPTTVAEAVRPVEPSPVETRPVAAPPPAQVEIPYEVEDDESYFTAPIVEDSPREGILSLVVLAVAGLAFFGGGIFWALNARVGPEMGFVNPLLVGWLAGVTGVLLFAIAIYLLLERLGRVSERG